MKIVAFGDSFVPVEVFRRGFAELERAHEIDVRGSAVVSQFGDEFSRGEIVDEDAIRETASDVLAVSCDGQRKDRIMSRGG